MKKHLRLKTQALQTAQHGFTLIELMISVAMGIVIIGAILVMYSSGSAANRNVQAQGQMNEDAQMALSVLTQELRKAGYNPVRAGGLRNDLKSAGVTLGGWNIFACDTGFTNNTTSLVSDLTCNLAGNSAALALVSEADLQSGKNTGGGLPMDCIGNGVAITGPSIAGGNYYTIQSRLFIANNALNCSGSGDFTQSQVLAENIESISLRFAMTEPSIAKSKQVEGYLSAGEIDTNLTLVAAVPLAVDRWNKIAAVRVCVVVRSEDRILADFEAAPTYINCNDESTAIADGRLRRAYRTTVILRNHGVGYVDQ